MPQNARKRAKLQFTMIRHDSTGCTSTHHDVAATLTNDREPKLLQNANRLGA